jgi:hypothetical protein
MRDRLRSGPGFARQRAEARATPPYRRKPLFEALEQRLLLSADPLAVVLPPPDPNSQAEAQPFSYTMADGANNVALQLQPGGAASTLQLIDRATAQVLAEQALAQTSEVIVMGSILDDRFEIDASVLDAGVAIRFEGGDGNDTVYGPAVDSTWNVTGAGSGEVAGVQFSGVENL